MLDIYEWKKTLSLDKITLGQSMLYHCMVWYDDLKYRFIKRYCTIIYLWDGTERKIDNSRYRLILELGKEMQINHHS
jgi:hypothetical protein